MAAQTFSGYILLADAGSTPDVERFWARRADTPTPFPARLARLRPELEASDAAREVFAREASLARNFDHDGLVRVVDSGEEEAGRPFVCHEVIDAVTLDELLVTLAQSRHLLPAGVLTEIALRLTEALSHVHAASGPGGRQLMLTHNGLSSRSVWITRQGTIKLDGFRLPGDTLPGRGLGPTGYVAPEILGGGRPDPRADLYALGVLLAEMATGRQLGTLDAAVLAAQLPGLLASRPDLPGRLPEVIEALCHPDPAQRPQLARMLAQQFGQLLGRVPDHSGLPGYLAPGVEHIRPATPEHPPTQLLAEVRAAGVTYPPRPEAFSEIVSIAPSGYDALSSGATPAPAPSGERLTLPLPSESGRAAAVAPEAEAPSPLLGFDAKPAPGRAPDKPWRPSEPGSMPAWMMVAMAVLAVVGAVALARVVFVGSEDDAPVRRTGVQLTNGAPRSANGQTQIKVTSEPAGALVYLDGEATGKVTPTTLPARIGVETRVSIALAKHRDPSPKTVTLKHAGDEARVHFRPMPLFYYRLASDPPDADVTFDGRASVDKTPVALPPMARGETVSVHVEKPGFMPQDLEIYAGTRTPTVTRVVLEPAVAYTITSSPEGAAVQIDGTTIGRTPIEDHPVRKDRRFTLRVVRPDARPYERTIVASGRATQRVKAKLRLRKLSALELNDDERKDLARISKLLASTGRARREARARLKKAKLRLRSFEHRREIDIDELETVKDTVAALTDKATEKDGAYERAQAEHDDLRRQVVERLELEQGY